MKLQELKMLSEGHLDPSIMLNLQSVIRRGFANNTFEFIVMGRLLQLIHSGKFFSTPDPLFNPFLSTSKPMLDSLRAMAPEEQVAVATRLLSSVEVMNGNCLPCSQGMDVLSWLKLFNAREATD